VVVDRSGSAPRVLMGRRPPRDRFMPDVWVFPGGRVDPQDRRARTASELRPEVSARLARDAGPRLGRALAVAAARETHEETGLLLGEPGPGGLAPDLGAIDYLARAITPAGSPIRYHARFFAVDAAELQGDMRSSDELIELDWWTLDRALSLPIIDVTTVVLEEALAWARDPSRARGRAAPLVHYRSARMRIRRCDR
jgi:8-oxo-dGTP pyrophosphatase MutT (NUDIX family)